MRLEIWFKEWLTYQSQLIQTQRKWLISCCNAKPKPDQFLAKMFFCPIRHRDIIKDVMFFVIQKDAFFPYGIINGGHFVIANIIDHIEREKNNPVNNQDNIAAKPGYLASNYDIWNTKNYWCWVLFKRKQQRRRLWNVLLPQKQLENLSCFQKLWSTNDQLKLVSLEK